MDTKLIELESLCKAKQDNLSMLANASAFLNDYLKDINWVGFYLYKNKKLILGPFQGKVACTTIDIGKGVCGTSFEKKMLLNVKDVHKFVGHIACDSSTNSEIVIPLIYNNNRYGVLDIDSKLFERFSADDEIFLEEAANIIAKYLTNKGEC